MTLFQMPVTTQMAIGGALILGAVVLALPRAAKQDPPRDIEPIYPEWTGRIYPKYAPPEPIEGWQSEYEPTSEEAVTKATALQKQMNKKGDYRQFVQDVNSWRHNFVIHDYLTNIIGEVLYPAIWLSKRYPLPNRNEYYIPLDTAFREAREGYEKVMGPEWHAEFAEGKYYGTDRHSFKEGAHGTVTIEDRQTEWALKGLARLFYLAERKFSSAGEQVYRRRFPSTFDLCAHMFRIELNKVKMAKNFHPYHFDGSKIDIIGSLYTFWDKDKPGGAGYHVEPAAEVLRVALHPDPRFALLEIETPKTAVNAAAKEVYETRNRALQGAVPAKLQAWLEEINRWRPQQFPPRADNPDRVEENPVDPQAQIRTDPHEVEPFDEPPEPQTVDGKTLAEWKSRLVELNEAHAKAEAEVNVKRAEKQAHHERRRGGEKVKGAYGKIMKELSIVLSTKRDAEQAVWNAEDSIKKLGE